MFLFFLTLPLTAAYEDEIVTDIRGYGEYSFSQTIDDLDLSEFEGPEEVITYEGIEYILYAREIEVVLSEGTANASLMLSFCEGDLSVIMLHFPNLLLNFGDLADAKEVANEIADTIMQKCDSDLVKRELLAIPDDRSFKIKYTDEEGDTISFTWDGFDLSVTYMISDDSYWDIAIKFNISLTELLKKNRLTENDVLSIGQELTIPSEYDFDYTQVVEHRIKAGECLSVIADQYGVSAADIARFNGLDADNTIYIGQVLTIPPQGGCPFADESGTEYYVVKPGDSTWLIARQHGIHVRTLLAYNNLTEESIITVGQRLKIPPSSEAPEDKELVTDIIDYGEYSFGQTIDNLDLSEFDGPIEDEMYEGIEFILYTREIEVILCEGTANASLMLYFYEGDLSVIRLYFPNLFTDFSDLPDVKEVATVIVDTFMQKYDSNSVKRELLAIPGGRNLNMRFRDEEGDTVCFIWDGYDLSVTYMTSVILEADSEPDESASVFDFTSGQNDFSISGYFDGNYTYYRIQVGDSLPVIADFFNLTVDEICEASNITNAEYLVVNQIIKLPGEHDISAFQSCSEEYIHEDKEMVTDITGYGDYIFGQTLEDLDLSDFEGPEDVTMYEGIEYTLYGRELEVTLSEGTANASLMLSFNDGDLSVIMLNFPSLLADFGDLDDVKEFAYEIGDTILQKYDPYSVERELLEFPDDWSFKIKFTDEEGDVIIFNWDAYDLSVTYMTSVILEDTLESRGKTIEDDSGKF